MACTRWKSFSVFVKSVGRNRVHDELHENEYVNNELSRNWIMCAYGKLMNNSCSGYLKISPVFGLFYPSSVSPAGKLSGNFHELIRSTKYPVNIINII